MGTRKATNRIVCHLHRLSAVAVISGLFGANLHAQGPNILLDAYGEVRDDAFDYMRMPLAGTDLVYSDIDGRHVKRLLNEVVAIFRRSRDDGNRYWGRIAGTKYEVMTADWTAEKFRAMGVEDIHRVTFDLPPQWMPRDWELTAAGSGETQGFSTAYPARAFNPNRVPRERWVDVRSMMPTPVDVEAVRVGLGTAADFAGRDVRGKAVVFQAMLAPGHMGNSANWEGVAPRGRRQRALR